MPKGYLAQSDLLDSAPEAAAQCPDLEHYMSGPRGDIFRRTIWIGPAGSWTPFHKDPYIGIYNQSTLSLLYLHHPSLKLVHEDIKLTLSHWAQEIPPPPSRSRTTTLPLDLPPIQKHLNNPNISLFPITTR
jgi:hypothetical protein